MATLKNSSKSGRGLDAVTRSEIIASLESATVAIAKTSESFGTVRCKRDSKEIASAIQRWLDDLAADIGALTERAKIGGVVSETLDWKANAGNFKKAKLPNEVHELIARKAQEIALQQYDTIRDIIVDSVCSNLACGMELSDVANCVETSGWQAGDVVLINYRDLQLLVSSASQAIDHAAQTIAAVKRIENHTGCEILYRMGNVAGKFGHQKIPSHSRLVEEVIDKMAANELDMDLVAEVSQ